jgi:hypothetical protein
MKLKFCHIPKTGGTYTKIILEENRVEYDSIGHKPVWEINKDENVISFSIVRNPYSLLVSMYYHHTDAFCNWNSRFNFKSFSEFVKWFCENNPFNQVGIRDSIFGQIFDKCNGKIYVNRVYKLEHYDLFIKDIGEIIGKPLLLNNEMDKNISTRKPIDISYKTLYDKNTKELVYQKFKKDFEFFGYDFDGSTSKNIIKA